VNPSTVSYSTLSHSAAASEISRAYAVEGVISCEFLNRGLNDTFRVQTGGGRFVFRVYRQGWRSGSEILFELDVLGHCDRAGVPVATPLAKTRRRVHFIDRTSGRIALCSYVYLSGGCATGESQRDAGALFWGCMCPPASWNRRFLQPSSAICSRPAASDRASLEHGYPLPSAPPRGPRISRTSRVKSRAKDRFRSERLGLWLVSRRPAWSECRVRRRQDHDVLTSTAVGSAGEPTILRFIDGLYRSGACHRIGSLSSMLTGKEENCVKLILTRYRGSLRRATCGYLAFTPPTQSSSVGACWVIHTGIFG
jgi:hypothetical protein